MKKIYVILVAAFLICSIAAMAKPSVLSGATGDPTSACSGEKGVSRVFEATAAQITTGAVCGDNAKMVLSECFDNRCQQKVQVLEAYKVNGLMPTIMGYQPGKYYEYQCYECPIDFMATDQCPITVKEGEAVSINWIGSDPDANIGPQGKLTYEYEGKLGADGFWQTEIGDAGIHRAKAKVYDGEFWDETDLCIEVVKVNSPPSLAVATKDVTVYEGETVTLSATCTDSDEDDTTTMSFSGWMTTTTRNTGYDDAGEYEVTVTCKDNNNDFVTEKIEITVLDRNRPPNIEWEQD